MIKVRDLRVAYGDQVVAHVPELRPGSASITGIAGESGSGKSQTALALMGLSGTAVPGSPAASGWTTSAAPR